MQGSDTQIPDKDVDIVYNKNDFTLLWLAQVYVS